MCQGTIDKSLLRADRDLLEARLNDVRTRAAGETEGIYGPDSVSWMVFRELAMLMCGPSAVLLQLAHPAVAAGVSQNSRFRADVLGRADRTFTTMNQVVFGDLDTAIAAARRLHNIHARVAGRVEGETRSTWSGRAYRANDPELKLWVHATLMGSSLTVFEKLFRPLTEDEKSRWYEEGRAGAALLGIPESLMPESHAGFMRYYDSMLSGPALAVGGTAKGLAEDIFRSPYSLMRFGRLVTAGTLPARWREAYGLSWTPVEERLFDALVAVLRRAVPRLPSAFRFSPAYHQASLRVARARGERPTRVARIIQRIDGRVGVPFGLRPVKGGGASG